MTFSQLWIDSGVFAHMLSTEKAFSPLGLYFDKVENYPPYMGVPQRMKTVFCADLSTRRASYPQINTSYPQTGCLNKQLCNALSPICGYDFSTEVGWF